LPLKILAYALFNRFYAKDEDINDLPLFLKASVIANLISGASDNACSCIDLFIPGIESSDLPSSKELYLLLGLGVFYIYIEDILD
jgi:hypothetical protein